MTFEVTFDDAPYPLPPELAPPPLGLLPSDQSPDKLALFEAVGRLQRDISRLSGRLQLNIKSQQEGLMKVEEALGELDHRFREQALIKPPPQTMVQGGGGVTLEQLNPALQKLGEQLTAIQRKVNPMGEQLDAVKGSYKEKIEEGQIERILPVLDSFERLFEQAGHSDDPKIVKWLEGVRMIHNQLKSYLRGQGVEEIPALGEPFDPNIFAAVGTDPTDAWPPNVISRVGRTGYRRRSETGEKILRVPEVFVAKPPTEEVRLDESQLTRAELLAKQKAEDEAEARAAQAPAPPTVQSPPPPPEPAPPSVSARAEPPLPAAVPKPVVPPAVAAVVPDEPLVAPLDPDTIEIGGGEDKFAEIRAKAEAALKGLFEPSAHIETAHPTPVADPSPPSAAPPSKPAMAGWGGIGEEAAAPATPPSLPEIEGGSALTGPGPVLDGGAEEYFANGEAVYDLRMELGLTMSAFWGHAFGKSLGDQQLMDLGEAIEREEESIDEKELTRLVTGLGLSVDELRVRFRTG